MTSIATTTSACSRTFRIAFDMTTGRDPGAGIGRLPAADAVLPGKCRRIIKASLLGWSLPHLVDDAQLLISELVTNALLHTRGELRILFCFGADDFVIVVRDGSPEHPVLREADTVDEHGRGLHLVNCVAASWGVSSDGTSTWCSLPLAPGPVQPAPVQP
ncbi:ATP-binding protein [Streptomyces sp. NPDC002932]|uniref:ATP-binding protein n=1 Tax=Streptomyces sp. NPDC002932 TaxID=3364672 RepID=UPI0036A505D5